jgi:SAM-dependent methyltransferase
VDIVADAHKLPYADGSVDHISCLAVLEHLSRPEIAVEEMARVLRPGGLIYLESPGLQPYHGYPSHFHNFTLTGHDALLARFGFGRIDSGAAIGPTSALAVLQSEYVRHFMPGGVVLARLFRLLTLPLVQADRWIANDRNAFMLCGSIYFLGHKATR